MDKKNLEGLASWLRFGRDYLQFELGNKGLAIEERSQDWGYTAKTLLGRWLDEQLSLITEETLKYFVWFTREANEIRNSSLSNPIRIFGELDGTVKSGGMDSPKIEETLARMVAAVSARLEIDDPAYRRITGELARATITSFRPQLWRLDLCRWAPDNYEEVRPNEFMTTGYTLPPIFVVEAIV